MHTPKNEKRRSEIQVDASYWISISDLMAGLATIFILALISYVFTHQERVKSLTDNERVRTDILRTLEAKIREEDGDLSVKIDTVHGVLRLKENAVLFERGSDILSETGRQNITLLSRKMYEVLSMARFKDRVETVFVEGHTDSVRMMRNSRFRSNWELSSQRAINTWQQMRSSAPLGDLRNNIDQPMFSCSGYADSRPIDETNRGAEQNRRIDIRFAMSPPKLPTAAISADSLVQQLQN